MGLLILMQPSKDGGVGAALGGGVAEATFGADTKTVFSKATIDFSIAFFILAFLLYLGNIYVFHHGGAGSALPDIPANIPATAAPTLPAAAAPATTVPAMPAQTPAVPAAPAPAQ